MPIPVLKITRGFKKYKRLQNKDFEIIMLRAFKDSIETGLKPLLMQMLDHWRISQSEKEASYDYIWDTTGNDWSVEVRIANKVLGFIEGGTSERWAIMRKGFVPKTRSGSISNVRGASPNPLMRGGAMVRGGFSPRPGISARNRLPTVRKIMNPRFRRLMNNAVRRAKRKAGF